MVRRRAGKALRTIQQRADADSIETTHHAVQEMLEESITEEDIKRALRAGKLMERQKEGSGGAKYVVRGGGADSRSIEVVCKLIPKNVRIITVYRVESKQ